MKKNVLLMAAAAMLFSGVMSSCKEKNLYPGYEVSETGLNYKFYVENEGEKPALGDILEVVFSCNVNDTTEIIPVMPNLFRLEEPLFAGDLFEGMAMMHKGDSASFIVDIDSAFVKFFGQPSLPSEFVPTDVMKFEVKLNDFYSESIYKEKVAEEARKVLEARIDNMKTSYPEQTVNAAQQLQDYFTANGIVAMPTQSGLVYVMTEEGNGEKPVDGQNVKVHYTGRLLDGTVFDSSVERGEPIEFPLGVGYVIPGWDEGIKLMSKGEKGVLYIPYYLAYGERDMGKIAPFSNLIFEVELVDF